MYRRQISQNFLAVIDICFSFAYSYRHLSIFIQHFSCREGGTMNLIRMASGFVFCIHSASTYRVLLIRPSTCIYTYLQHDIRHIHFVSNVFKTRSLPFTDTATFPNDKFQEFQWKTNFLVFILMHYSIASKNSRLTRIKAAQRSDPVFVYTSTHTKRKYFNFSRDQFGSRLRFNAFLIYRFN